MSFVGTIYSIKVFTFRLIMKNSFKTSKDISASKLKDNFLRFSMLLVKESKFMIHKKSLKSEHYWKNYSSLIKKTILQKFMIP